MNRFLKLFYPVTQRSHWCRGRFICITNIGFQEFENMTFMNGSKQERIKYMKKVKEKAKQFRDKEM